MRLVLPEAKTPRYNLESAAMNVDRIADLLASFLRADLSHSEPAKAGEACPERSQEPAPILPKVESAFLSPSQLQSISTYIDILVRWNSRINLTAIRDPEDIVTRHFGESLFAARHLFPGCSSVSPVPGACPDAGRVVKAFDSLADLGSGAGFPGLPIKIWSPNNSLTLIESNHKKAAFLSEVVRSLTLTNVNIQNTRAESLTESLHAGSTTTGAFDVVTLRAVEHFAAILPTAAALVAPAGRLALLIGAAQQDQALATVPHFKWSTPVPIPKSRSRILLLAHRTPPEGKEARTTFTKVVNNINNIYKCD
jgi:16S rRNA (guanine527-N7)-methyltransferase